MAHYKIYIADTDGPVRHVNGAAYTAVPAGNNSAGIPWSQVIREYRGFRNRRIDGSLEVTVPVTDPSIQAGIDAGTLFEWRWDIDVPTAANAAAAIAAIEAGINDAEATVIARISEELRFWGREGDS